MRPNLLVDSRDARFVLFEMFDILKLSEYDLYKEFDRDTYEAVLDLAEQIAMEEVYPANTIADKEGVTFNPDDHTVIVPQVYKKAMQAFNEAGFMMGSMGSVVGEKLARAIERAVESRIPVVIFSTSGGARMQEGILSLYQMAKTSAALGKLAENHLLYISVLTDPTFGGVTASYASLGDILIAEPNALIGFTGPRVIKQTIRQELPPDAQTAEFNQEHGLIDLIVPRAEMRSALARLLKYHQEGAQHGSVV